MKKQEESTKLSGLTGNETKTILPGYPLYPDGDDIYNKYKKDKHLDTEDVTKIKVTNENTKIGKNNEKDFDEDFSGNDLDVPGSELDDQQEDIGSEDEENNYYSIGGDGHDNLEEDNEE